jgi:hypothetical protein
VAFTYWSGFVEGKTRFPVGDAMSPVQLPECLGCVIYSPQSLNQLTPCNQGQVCLSDQGAIADQLVDLPIHELLMLCLPSVSVLLGQRIDFSCRRIFLAGLLTHGILRTRHSCHLPNIPQWLDIKTKLGTITKFEYFQLLLIGCPLLSCMHFVMLWRILPSANFSGWNIVWITVTND